MKRTLRLLFLSSVLSVAQAAASPREAAQYLMREPVSMLTYGIYEISKDMEKQNKEIGFDNVFVSYDWGSDQIRISPWCFRCGLEATEAACGEVISAIRRYAHVEHGKPMVGKGSTLTTYFEQAGFNHGDQPKDLAAEIDKMFLIEVSITQNAAPGAKPEDRPEGNPILKQVSCSAPLLGEGYSVKHK